VLKSLGYTCFIVNASPTPDIIAIGGGEILLVEVKVVKSVKSIVRVPNHQLDFLKKLRDAINTVAKCRAIIVVYVEDDEEFHEIDVDNFESETPLDLLI